MLFVCSLNGRHQTPIELMFMFMFLLCIFICSVVSNTHHHGECGRQPCGATHRCHKSVIQQGRAAMQEKCAAMDADVRKYVRARASVCIECVCVNCEFPNFTIAKCFLSCTRRAVENRRAPLLSTHTAHSDTRCITVPTCYKIQCQHDIRIKHTHTHHIHISHLTYA